MKKLISIVLLMAVLVSLCACGKEKAMETTAPVADTATEPVVRDETQMTPEELYGHIDQTVPKDGVYQIWNKDGVNFMLKNPDAKFVLLCNVDMGGAEIAPIAQFTGSMDGANFTISNFTVKGGSEESFGMISVNKGNVTGLTLENVTFVPGSNAKNIGSLVGDNQGTLLRCTIGGAMNVDKAPAGVNCGSLVGVNTGILRNITGKTVEMNDGLFEVTLVHMPANPLELTEIFTVLLSNDILQSPLVEKYKANRILVRAEERINWTLDGEFGGSYMRTEIRNLQKALHIFA